MATTKRTHTSSSHATSQAKHANATVGKSTRGGTHEQHVEAGRKGGLAAHSSRGRQKKVGKAMILAFALLIPTFAMAYGYTDSFSAQNEFAGQQAGYAGTANYGNQNGPVGAAANVAGSTLNTAGNVAGNTLNAAGNVASNTVGAVASIF